MHELRDDALERELTRLSEYSGSPDAPQVWEAAMEAHRRERDRQVWVWVRRPASALAAACLAVLVAAVALRPSPNRTTNFDSDGRVNSESLASGLTRQSGDTRPLSPGGIGGAGGGGGGSYLNSPLPRELTQNTRGIDNLTARTDADAVKEFGTAGNVSPDAVRRMTMRGADRDAGGAGLLWNDADAGEVPAPSTTVTLGLSDVNHFYYKALPALVNQKLGDQLADHQLMGEQPKDAALGVRVTLKVNENRLPQVLDELRKAGTVTVDQTELLSKETRLSLIDAQLENEKKVAARFAEDATEKMKAPGAPVQDPKNAPARPAAAGAGAGAGADELAATRDKVEANIEQLARRRQQIEKEGELATLNVVAVPESVLAASKKDGAGAADGAAPGSRASAASGGGGAGGGGGRAAGRQPADLSDKTVAANRAEPPAQPGKASEPADAKAKMEEQTRLAAKTEEPAPKAAPLTPAAMLPSPLPTPPPPSPTGANGQAAGAAAAPIVAASDAEKKRDGYRKSFDRKQIQPPNVQPAPAAADAPQTSPAATTPGPVTAAKPSSTVEAGKPAGAGGAKIGEAAKEGWANLGDSAANLVRTAIGTMLYWVPALAAAIVGIWWYRRRKAEQMREPPPSS